MTIPNPLASLVAWVALAIPTAAQNLLPNPGFEEGTDRPKAWRAAGGKAQWSPVSRQGKRSLAVTGTGEDSGYWRTEDLALKPGGLCRLSFYARQEVGTSGGCAFAGPSRVNRDFQFTDSWQRYSFVFAVPHDGTNDFIRLGQWQVKGTLYFDEVDLLPVLVTHRWDAKGLELGEGETVEEGIYRFPANLGWLGANYHPPLWVNHANFNSDRWIFFPGAHVVYRHRVEAAPQQRARVRVSINHHVGGTLRVEASRDGTAWEALAEFDGTRRGGWSDLPASLFPADQILVRLSQLGAGEGFQVNSYEYEAPLVNPPADADGETHFIEVLQTIPGVEVQVEDVRLANAAGHGRLDLVLRNQTQKPLRLAVWSTVEFKDALKAGPNALRKHPEALLGSSSRVSVALGWLSTASRAVQVILKDQATTNVLAVRLAVSVGLLQDSGFGHRLEGNRDLGLWWCESGCKVGRDRGLPEAAPRGGRPKPVSVSAARGEFESVQIVLRPGKDGALRSAKVGPLQDARGRRAPIEVQIGEVAYVHVAQPTDSACVRGWYPDPLPALRTPLVLREGQNQPLWLTFRVPPGVRTGDYSSELTLETSLGETKAALRIHVYDFELPRETHLRSALGLGAHEINRYHKLTRPEDRQAVFEKYLKNFAEHRISPYTFYDYAPIDLRFVGEGTNKQAKVDFAKFDQAAAKWLDEYRFNTFQLPLQGMGGGTFHSRHLGELAGFKEGTPEHARLFQDYLSQVERHLRERGWLNQAFTYWFDEPDPKDYEFVVEGMKRLKAAAPGIKRMLTEQPEPALRGHVDIWCGLTPEWTAEKVKACRDAGEEVWWYICTAPKAPYVTEFIDHPGTELRLWPWQSWQYGVKGILIWATMYWTSPLAYPEPTLQDPWSDPMSWVSGYGNPVGYRSPWGNGDGRFLYPPRRDPNTSTEPCLDEPINSIRWENLRDGMEDYEYFWLLQKAVERAETKKVSRKLVEQARALLTVPPEVSKDLTHFTTDPRPMLQHRDKIARMIERLPRE
jgi:hypothetical protein